MLYTSDISFEMSGRPSLKAILSVPALNPELSAGDDGQAMSDTEGTSQGPPAASGSVGSEVQRANHDAHNLRLPWGADTIANVGGAAETAQEHGGGVAESVKAVMDNIAAFDKLLGNLSKVCSDFLKLERDELSIETCFPGPPLC